MWSTSGGYSTRQANNFHFTLASIDLTQGLAEFLFQMTDSIYHHIFISNHYPVQNPGGLILFCWKILIPISVNSVPNMFTPCLHHAIHRIKYKSDRLVIDPTEISTCFHNFHKELYSSKVKCTKKDIFNMFANKLFPLKIVTDQTTYSQNYCFQKILEKFLYKQLKYFLDKSVAFEVFQSGFKAHHSTKSALLRVFNYIFSANDSGHSILLVLLDLTTAFDTVDYNILSFRHLTRSQSEVSHH